MASAKIDLTLPPSSPPAIGRLLHKPTAPGGLLPGAVYTHINLTDEETARLLQACNIPDLGRDWMRLAPQHNFSGRPLRASFDYHINNVAPQGEFDPFYYVVVVDKDWEKSGVMFVNLDVNLGVPDSEHKVDKLVAPATDVGLILANLQVANMDWEEFRRMHGNNNDVNDDSGDNNDDNEETDKREDGDISSE